MQLIADDPINRSIWTESVALQRKIVERKTRPLRVGGQQAMPKACEQGLFSPESPLPWVPDLVSSRFGSDGRSVLVVASSYNGFIEGYSSRAAVLPLADYLKGKKAGVGGLAAFLASFKKCVVDPDEDYYQPILRDLLPPAGCDSDACCLTDLCKASFLECGSGPDNGSRGDRGNDRVLQTFWPQWIPYLTGVAGGQGDGRLPYQWLWQRMQQCRVIIALGTSRRIIGFGVQAAAVDGVALCRMFNQAISGEGLPRRLSADHDPLFQFHRWQAICGSWARKRCKRCLGCLGHIRLSNGSSGPSATNTWTICSFGL
jgi:hypothetical protein